MTIELSCPQCGKQYRLKDEMAGKQAKCRGCGKRLSIPDAKPEPSQPDDELDAYELDTSGDSGPMPDHPDELGHTIEPQVSADDDDLELAPREAVKPITAMPFLDDDGNEEGSRSPAARTARGVKRNDAHKQAESLVVESVQEEPKREPSKPCPSCNGQIQESAVFCVQCGFDLRTGEKKPPLKKRKLGRLFGRGE